MRLLLDTHAFLWTLSAPKRLPAAARNTIANADNEVLVSAVTFWEISIKIRLGKLRPAEAHPSDLVSTAETLGFLTIPLSPDEAATYGGLSEPTHNDPFDRMLAWQAISRKLVLVSGDREFERFKPDGLKLLWK